MSREIRTVQKSDYFYFSKQAFCARFEYPTVITSPNHYKALSSAAAKFLKLSVWPIDFPC